MEHTDPLLKWIRFAIETEEKGIEFYRKCMREVKNARAVEFFDFVIKIEQGHKEILTKVMNATAKGNKAALDKSLDEYMAMDYKNPMFPKEKEAKMLEPTATIHDMFNTAIKLEEDGIALYKRLAKEHGADNRKLKELFLKLAQDESDHRDEIRNMGFYVFGMPLPTTEDI